MKASTRFSERTLRISAASFLALLMVSAAYLFSGPNIFTTHAANAGSTDALLKAYASKDSDGDGLPDWEEALYGTDPNKAISNPYGIPDGQAAQEGKLTPNALATQLPSANQGTTTLTDADFGGVPAPAPGSITDQFSQQFLQEFAQASNGQPMNQATQDQLVQNLISQFTQQGASTFTSTYTPVQVHTNAGTTITEYAAGLEQAITDNDIPLNETQLGLMADVLQNNNSTAKKSLLAVSASYQGMADDMKNVQVPPSQIQNHVALIQSLEVMAKATNTVANYQKDPLGTMGALSAYDSGVDQYAQALTNIANAILANGEPADGAPGSFIVLLGRLSSS